MFATQKVTELGQSLWFDNIQRGLLIRYGKGALTGLEKMIADGDIRGVTSNPSIFHNAIANSADYDDALVPMALADESPEAIFWDLAIDDIQKACDQIIGLYEKTNKTDGYVSLEVSPLLANETQQTIQQAKELWAKVNRPNLMIKIPATKAGLPAIREVIAAGINVNVTLIFSIDRYHSVMDAYLSGLEDRLVNGGDIEPIHSVASFFVSRVDSKIDPKLTDYPALQGKAAIANAKLAYEAFQAVFAAERFGKLQLAKANYQRPLWASTGTKNPNYSDVLYVNELIGPATVNTVPPATLLAFKDHGSANTTLLNDVEESKKLFADLAKVGVDLQQVTDELEAEGVKAFEDAFIALLASIAERKTKIQIDFGALAGKVRSRVENFEKEKIISRIWAHDPTVWTYDPDGQREIKIRLGWLRLPEKSKTAIAEINEFAAETHARGIKKFLLFGMGGSSLAPEVVCACYQIGDYFQFAILDSTDPAQVLEAEGAFPLGETLYIVASKSGGTAEINAMFHYFYSKASEKFGADAGKHFIAVTDPGTGLEKLAQEKGFLRVFNADPNIGGRYSALTHFGLVPGALMGVDLDKYLASAGRIAERCAADKAVVSNPGAMLGIILGEAALLGKDKISVIAETPFDTVGSWLEQLVAESTGKQNKGILPIDLEPYIEPASSTKDRIAVYLKNKGEKSEVVRKLQVAGIPLLVFPISDPEELSAEFYRWEFATAVASAILGVNAFDQPDVQEAKTRTNAKIDEYIQTGKLPEGKSIQYTPELRVYKQTGDQLNSIREEIVEFSRNAKPGTYVAINAYVPRNNRTLLELTELRAELMRITGLPVTLGFGPRFQHSTGQYHKGGTDQGLFLQITTSAQQDFLIPEKGLSFATLELAQALGDQEAILAKGRRVIRVHLASVNNLANFTEALK